MLAATRDAARETRRAASAALDWSDLRLDRHAVEHGRAEQPGDGARESAPGRRTQESGPASAGEPRAAAGDGTREGRASGAREAGVHEVRAQEARAQEAGAREVGDGTPEAGAEDGWFDRAEQSGQPEPAGH